MDSNDEESKNLNDDESSNFPLINIYNKIQLSIKDSSDNLQLNENNYIYICGKMFNHSSLAKYSFEACEFYLYSPTEKKLYHSLMNSEDCFSNAIKWNKKLFKNIRECLTKDDINLKKYYFIINNNGKESKEKEDLILENNKTYLELHFFAKKKDVVSFRLLLEEIIQNDIDIFFMNQVLMLDNECEEDLLAKKRKNSNKIMNLTKLKIILKELMITMKKRQKKF